MPLLAWAVDPGATTGKLIGKVVDKTTKQPLQGANILVFGTQRGVATNQAGQFIIPDLNEEVYKLKISYLGYHTLIETDVRVIRQKTTDIEDIELTPSAIESEDILVTAGLFAEDEQAAVSHYIYTREEINRTPGSSGDVFRAMEALPGVSTSGGEFSAFSVRGGSPKENIILIDNIPFDKVTHFNRGTSEEQEAQGGRFSIFAPGLIEEAKFQAGGFSPIYGGKFSSLLDLTVKEGNRQTPTITGRFDLLGWETSYDGPSYIHHNTSLLVSARHQNFTRILELTGQEALGSPRFTDLIVKTTTEFNGKHKLSVLAIHAPENFDRSVTDVFESDDFAQTDLVDLDEQKTLLGVNWRALTSSSSFLQSTLYMRRTKSTILTGRAWPIFQNGPPPLSSAQIGHKEIFRENSKEIEWGTRHIFTYLPNNQSELTAGFELNRTTFDLARSQNGLDTLFVFDQDDFRPDPTQNFIVRRPEFANTAFNDRKTILAAFSKYMFSPFQKFTIDLGVRYSYNQFNRQHYWAPRGSIRYRLTPKTRISLAAGMYYQTPAFDILIANPANAQLRHERASHYILSFTRYMQEDLKFTAETYYKQFNDLIVRNDRTNLIRTNAGDGHAGGLDLSLIKRFVGKFYGQTNYSYAYSLRNNRDGHGSYNADFNQPHIFSISSGYEFNKTWRIAAKWRYATGRPTDSFVVHSDIFNDPSYDRYSKEIIRNNGRRLPDFHTFNIRIDSRRQIGRIALVGFFDIVNMYNHLNVNEDRFQEINGQEDARGFRILPTGGMRIEF